MFLKRSQAILLFLIPMIAAVPRTGSAETRTVSWNPSTAYTDGIPFEQGVTVAYDVFWSVDPGLAATSLRTIASAVTGTSAIFDPDSVGMSRGQTVYVTAQAVLSTGARSALASAFTWSVPTLSSLSISGPLSVGENGSATYTATARWSDNTTTAVTPSWSENSAYASIGAGGVLTAGAVTASQQVTVSASCTVGGVTQTASQSVTIVDSPATLAGLSISGPSSVNENGSATYTAIARWSDNTTTAVTPSWSEDSAYASIGAGGVLTATAVTGTQPVTVSASYTAGGVTQTASQSVTIVDSPATLAGLSISGPSSLTENGSATYTATARWSDNTTTAVTPSWSDNSAYASISAAGVLTATAVTGSQPVTVSASYTSGGATRTAAVSVTIVDAPADAPAAPRNVAVDGPLTTASTRVFRVQWDAVTTYADGTPIAVGSNVSYTAYWSTDPGLSAATLQPLASATSTTSLEFDPAAEGMARNQRVFLTAKATISSGAQSALAAALAWRASNSGPTPPMNGRIYKR